MKFPLLLKRLYNACLDTFPKKLENGFRTCGLYPLNKNDVLIKVPKTISNALVEQSVHETLISLLEEHCEQRKGRTKRSKGKRCEAGLIANREPPVSAENSEEEEMEDDGMICKICKISFKESSNSWVHCNLCNYHVSWMLTMWMI